MTRSTRLAALVGAVSAVAVLPATASAHTTQGTAACVLAQNVPTITTTVRATSFAASGNGGGGRNTIRYEVVIDGTATSGQYAFTGTAGDRAVTSASTAGTHTVRVFTQWLAAETRDGHSQGRTEVASVTVTCPAATTPPPTTPPPSTPPPATPPPTTPPPATPPPVEEPPVVTPPPAEEPPAAPPLALTPTPVSAPSTSPRPARPAKPSKPKAQKPKAPKRKKASPRPERAQSTQGPRRPRGDRTPGFTG